MADIEVFSEALKRSLESCRRFVKCKAVSVVSTDRGLYCEVNSDNLQVIETCCYYLSRLYFIPAPIISPPPQTFSTYMRVCLSPQVEYL